MHRMGFFNVLFIPDLDNKSATPPLHLVCVTISCLHVFARHMQGEKKPLQEIKKLLLRKVNCNDMEVKLYILPEAGGVVIALDDDSKSLSDYEYVCCRVVLVAEWDSPSGYACRIARCLLHSLVTSSASPPRYR